MLTFERNAFECLGWSEQMWRANRGSPAAWDKRWSDLTSEMRVCGKPSCITINKLNTTSYLAPAISPPLASTIGYSERRWSCKPKLDQPSGCDTSGKWYMPLNMAGQERTVDTAAGCSARCKNTEGCNYWNRFPNGGCHITTG